MPIPKEYSFTTVNIEAIQRLVHILENTPDQDFNIGSWSCGTVHCAAGLAALNPWFNSKGFKLGEHGFPEFRSTNPENTYPINCHWGAVTTMFQLTQQEAEWLFSGHEYLEEYPEPKWTEEEKQTLMVEDDHSQNLLFRNIPKSAVIARLNLVLELKQ